MVWKTFLNVEAAVWVFGVSVMAYFSIRDFLPILDSYENNNIAVEIDVVENESPRRPDILVCIPYHSNSLSQMSEKILKNASNDCEECEAMKNKSWDVWNDENFPQTAFFNLSNLKIAITNAIVNKILKDEENGFTSLILNRSNFNWNQPLIDALWNAINCIRANDIYMLDESTVREAACPKEYLLLIDIVPRMTIDTLCNLMSNARHVYTVRRVGYLFEEDPSQLATLDINGPCVRFLENATSEAFFFEAFPSNEPNIKPPWKRFSRTTPLTIFESADALFTQVIVSTSVYRTDGDKLSQLNYEKVVLSYSVANKVIERRPNQPCSKLSSAAECLANYKVQRAIKYCRCIPFRYRQLTTNSSDSKMPYCNGTTYALCLNKINEGLQKQKDFCNQKCEHTFYNWKYSLQQWANEKKESDFGYMVQITPVSKPFVEFGMTIRDSPEQFLNQLGGIVNFYLGVSGTSVCVIIVYLISEFKKRHQSKNAIAAENDQNEIQSNETRLFQRTAFATNTFSGTTPFGNNEASRFTKEEIKILKQEMSEEFRKTVQTALSKRV